ncbi:MAG: hypothetical protein U9O98_10390, partial [Asgard group archaeon]|nr:hypothetical protein [Asgard group archaeon]
MNEEKFPEKKAIKMQLASIENLVRMAFSSSARNHSLNLLIFQCEEKWYLGFLTAVGGYYNMKGVPMFFYIVLDEKPDNLKFMAYTSKNKEKWEFVDNTSDPTKWNYLPIIELA